MATKKRKAAPPDPDWERIARKLRVAHAMVIAEFSSAPEVDDVIVAFNLWITTHPVITYVERSLLERFLKPALTSALAAQQAVDPTVGDTPAEEALNKIEQHQKKEPLP